MLHGISLHIAKGEKVALVGESGSGKSVTARIVLGLLQEQKNAKITGGLEFEGRNLNAMTARQRKALRGTDMSMIFQDPSSSLNPVYTIEVQFHEVLKRARPDVKRAEARALALQALADVAINEPERVLDSLRLSAVRWHEPACDDCHGACQQSLPCFWLTSREQHLM